MSELDWVVVIGCSLSAIVQPVLVGRDREPLTPGVAVVTAAIYVVTAIFVLAGWLR